MEDELDILLKDSTVYNYFIMNLRRIRLCLEMYGLYTDKIAMEFSNLRRDFLQSITLISKKQLDNYSDSICRDLTELISSMEDGKKQFKDFNSFKNAVLNILKPYTEW